MKDKQDKLPEHHGSHMEVISSVIFVIFVVIGMYILSGYLNN